MGDFNWKQVIGNMLTVGIAGYAAGGWKVAIAALLSNAAGLFQTAPHQQ